MIDLRKPFTWEDINEQIKSQMGVSCGVRYYQSVSQAILEVSMGFQNLYSHKRQFYFHLGLGTHADEALLNLSKQGIKATDVFAEKNFDEKKTLFCILDLDDAITAEIYKNQYTLDEKIFTLNISHQLHYFEKNITQPKESEVIILNCGVNGAVALFGKRCVSLPGAVAATLSWPMEAPTIFPWPVKTENESWIKQVENEKWAEGKSILADSTKRLYDRAIIAWIDLEGEALRQTLIKEHGVKAASIESLSLSRWNELKLIAQFEKRGWSPEIFRGTLLLASELANDSDFKSKLASSVQKLRLRSKI
jgi:hypothetical protein